MFYVDKKRKALASKSHKGRAPAVGVEEGQGMAPRIRKGDAPQNMPFTPYMGYLL